MARFYGISETHREVKREIGNIKQKHDLEVSLGKRTWIEVLTGPEWHIGPPSAWSCRHLNE